MPNCAVIDLGSNTIRLVVYEVRSPKEVRAGSRPFKSLVNDKVMAGLAAFVSEGIFSDEGIARATSVLKGHLKRATALNCKQVHIFATAVLRNAVNCAEATCALEQAIGYPIKVLSAQEEARLGFVGARIDGALGSGTLVDIGGGSTELTCVRDDVDVCGVSIACGSLSTFTQFVSGILPTEDEMRAIHQAFIGRFRALGDAVAPAVAAPAEVFRAQHLFGVGGSIRAASKMLAQLRQLPGRPTTLTPTDLDELLGLCVADPNTFAHAALKACVERVHTVVPGCVILRAVFEKTGATDLRVCKHGIREGYLMTYVLDRLREGKNDE